jgi:hypothetical protein
MKFKRICKICGNEFTAIKSTQFFCKRKCFKKSYYLKLKDRIQDMQYNPAYPLKECGFCLKTSRLPFDPIKKPKLYDSWGCPYCGATNELVWKNQDTPNSYQVISEILISIQMFSGSIVQQKKEPVYEIYQLPIPRLEQGSQKVIIMPCEKMNIFDIQKKNRKKILFS